MSNCLLDFIGIRGCSTDEPLSGKWINSYAGMSSELADKIASADQVTYAQVWADVQSSCYDRLKTDVQQVLKTYAHVRLDQVIFQSSKIFVQEWQTIQPNAAEAIYKGVFASINGSKYVGLRLKKAYIYNSGSVAVDNVPIKVYQTQDSKVLYETTKTIQPGMNEIAINRVFTLNFDKINIALLVDCTNLPTLKGAFLDYGWNASNDECASQWSQYLFGPGYSNFPVQAPLDFGLDHNWNQNSSSNGIYWDAQLICSLDSFICEQREDMIDIWGQLLCSGLLEAKMLSGRVNYFTQSNRDYTERAIATYLERYEKALSNWAEQLNLSGEGLCFNCSDVATVGRTAMRL